MRKPWSANSSLRLQRFRPLLNRRPTSPVPTTRWVRLSMAVTACLAIVEVGSKAVSSALSSVIPEGVVKSVLFPLLLVVVIGGMSVTGRVAWWTLGEKDVGVGGRLLGVVLMVLCSVSAYFGARFEAGKGLDDFVAVRETLGGCASGTGGQVTLRLPSKAAGAPNGFGFSWCRTGADTPPSILDPSVPRGFSTQSEGNGECVHVHLDSVPKVLRFRECATEGSQPATLKAAGTSATALFATKFWEDLEWYERWAF